MSIPSLMELAAFWRTTLLADSALAAYCTGTLGGALELFVGYDTKNPPTIGNAPFIVIEPNASSPGLTEGAHTWSCTLHMAIVDSEYSDFNSNGSTEMRGLYRIDTMWGLVLDALETAANGKNLIADALSYQIMPEAFPLIQAQATINSSLPNTIGITITL